MKLIGLVGSPRGLKGNTARLVRIVLEGAESAGAQTETIVLKGDSVLPCLGCDTCHKRGRCPQKDSFQAIHEKILESDGLVLGSPNYIFSVSAQMKAFMDRCCGIIHCLGFEGRYGASVVTSGGGDEESIARYIDQFLTVTGIMPVGSVWATMGASFGEPFPEEIFTRAFELGKKLVKAWQDKNTTPEFQAQTAAFRERMRSLILYRKGDWPFEYEYWKENRGLD